MTPSAVTMRDMRQDEYDAYTAERELDFAESLDGVLPFEAALEQARQGTARFLPDGLATEGHRLLVAENAAGQAVGYTWIGFVDPRSKSTETAWLHDIRVAQPHRRCGYGRAMLAAVEALARDTGAVRLGLNVFGRNLAAIALYEACGYEVTSQEMAKRLRQPGEAHTA
jgi:GNAT superfamily N-acetyltransferase